MSDGLKREIDTAAAAGALALENWTGLCSPKKGDPFLRTDKNKHIGYSQRGHEKCGETPIGSKWVNGSAVDDKSFFCCCWREDGWGEMEIVPQEE
jgi:hypothetical protein